MPTGGTVTTVSGTMPLTGDILSFAWAPDSSRLAFEADRTTDNVEELYTVLPTGGTVTTVSGTMPTFGDIISFTW